MSTFLTPYTAGTTPLFGAAGYDDSLASFLAFLMDDDFTPPPPAAFFPQDDDAAEALLDVEVDGGGHHGAAVLFPPAVMNIAQPPPQLVPMGECFVFRACADDEAGAWSSRPAAAAVARRRRALQGSWQPRGGGRRVWVQERSTEWWDHLSGPECPAAEFRRAFRMSPATMDKLCHDLGAAIAKEDTALRAAIPVRQRVAVCLWRLATGEPLREVSRRFGLGISTCHNIVLQVCAAIAAVLLPAAVRWPEYPADAASRFEAIIGIPGVVGVVYTDHIPIVTPKEKAGDYYNRRLTDRNQKASYSVAVQAVVDADGAFVDVCIGAPGSLLDAAVLEASGVYDFCEAGLLGAGAGDDGRRRQLWLVGGGSHPLKDWMLVPYRHPNLTRAQHKFNERVADARGVARAAFGRLKARWRCLQRRTEAKVLADLHNMLAACCVLHNLCERSREGLDPDLHYELPDDDVGADEVPADPVRTAAAEQERGRVAHSLLHGDGEGFF